MHIDREHLKKMHPEDQTENTAEKSVLEKRTLKNILSFDPGRRINSSPAKEPVSSKISSVPEKKHETANDSGSRKIAMLFAEPETEPAVLSAEAEEKETVPLKDESLKEPVPETRSESAKVLTSGTASESEIRPAPEKENESVKEPAPEKGKDSIKEPAPEKENESTKEPVPEKETENGKRSVPEKKDKPRKKQKPEKSAEPEKDLKSEKTSGKKEPAETGKERQSRFPKKYILLIIALVILLAAGVFKVYMDTSHKPGSFPFEPDTSKLNVSITDNSIDIRNMHRSNRGEKAGIILYSELRVEADCYLPLMSELADKGYDCFLPRSTGNQPFLNVEGADSIIRKYSGIKHWYLLGHSRSCTPAALYTADHQPVIKGLIFLGGSSDADISQLDIPLLSVTGTKDTVINRDRFEANKAHAPARTEYRTIEGGNNTGFVNTSVLLPGDSEADIPAQEQIAVTANMIDSFIYSDLSK